MRDGYFNTYTYSDKKRSFKDLLSFFLFDLFYLIFP